MKVNAAFWVTLFIYFLRFVNAQDAVDDDDDEDMKMPTVDDIEPDVPDIEPETESVDPNIDPAILANITRPTFVPTTLNAPFLEQFTDNWESRWKISNAKKGVKSGEEEWQYVGKWAVEEPVKFKAIDGDKGLVVQDAAAHHAISAKFPQVIDPKGKTLVVQYEVKLQEGLDCGGAYLKLLQDNKALHSEEFSNTSPYVIMFGPDRCGSTNKIHLIFKHKSPVTGEYEEKHLEEELVARIEKTSNLYTLIVQPNNTYEVRVNGEKETSGSLLTDFTPPVNPPKEIDDPDDKKPEDWVDEAQIPDPDDKKPDDWDEDAPFEIEDIEAVKPADWLDDEPTEIPDPEAKKPEDWNDEEDGDWLPPMVPNPKCADGNCGEWKRPKIKNPAYKGPWSAKDIDNPAYKGEWAPRKIPNKDFFEDLNPANFEPMGAIGFELWTMTPKILFDNIYIGHSIEDAEALKKETFDIKHPLEQQLEAATKPKHKPLHTEKPDIVSFKESPVLYVRQKIDQFITAFKKDPLEAVKTVPEVAGGIGVVLVTLIALILGSFGSSAAVQEKAKEGKDKAKEAKDKAAEAIATGVEKAQNEVNKRTTRSAVSGDS